MLGKAATFLVSTVGSWGYTGIFILMFLESSFFPFPSEVVMIPAGYLAYKGDMNLLLVVMVGVLGSLTGALFNYWLGYRFGRGFLLRYGRYVLLSRKRLSKVERFFREHGEVTTFVGRLLPGVRQYISFPPGFSGMKLLSFSLYTSLGAFMWVSALSLLGFFVGKEEKLVREGASKITIAFLIFSLVVVIFYITFKKKNDRHSIRCSR